MKSGRRFLFGRVAPILLLISFSSVSAYADLITNGKFAGLTGWTYSGWGYSSGTVGSADGTTTYADTGCVGSACITVPNAYVRQTLATTTGSTYTLTFSYDAGTSATTANTELQVVWNGSVVDALLTNSASTWIDYTVAGLTATSTSTVLEFDGRQDPATLYLTNVSVNLSSAPIPEPSSLALLGTFLAVVGWRLHRIN